MNDLFLYLLLPFALGLSRLLVRVWWEFAQWLTSWPISIYSHASKHPAQRL